MAASQIQGFTTANIAEVEANTKALRATLRDVDVGALGGYSMGIESGLMAAGLATAAPIFSMRWGDATRLALIKRVTFSAANSVTAFAAGIARFDLFVARSYSVADTGGTSFLPTGNVNKLRTSFGTTLFSDVRASATATLTAGTRTLDANPIAAVVGGVPATVGVQLVAPFAIFDQRPGEHPLLLAQNEGIVLQATVPATGTWGWAIKVDWVEVTAY